MLSVKVSDRRNILRDFRARVIRLLRLAAPVAVLSGLGWIAAIIANTDNNAVRARAALERLAARRIDGAIIATATARDPLIEQCRSLGLPAVLVNRATTT